MIEIQESKMLFGPYEEADIFKIETSSINQKAGEKIGIVEFVLRRNENKILFIEAKSSSPRENTSKERYNEFISEITNKFLNSFELYQALLYGRYETDEQIGKNLKELNWKVSEIKFVLIINGHAKEWLVPIREALIKNMRNFLSIWKGAIIVLNEEMAKQKHLITGTVK